MSRSRLYLIGLLGSSIIGSSLVGCSEPAAQKDPAPASTTSSSTGKASSSSSSSAKATSSATPSTSAAAKDAPKPESGEVTFERKAYAVGQKMLKKNDRITDMKVSAKGQEVPVHEEFHAEYTREILALDGAGTPTKVKVTYSKHVKTRTTGPKTAPEEKLLEGKTYIVERKDAALVMTDEAGKPVSAAEEKQLAKDLKGVGKPDEVTLALVSKPRKVGDSLDDVVKALADKAAGDNDGKRPETKDIKLTLRSVEGTTALCDLSLTLVAENGKLTIKVAGTVKLQTDDADVSELKLTGPLTMTGDPSAQGTFTSNESESRP